MFTSGPFPADTPDFVFLALNVCVTCAASQKNSVANGHLGPDARKNNYDEKVKGYVAVCKAEQTGLHLDC